MRIIQSFRMAFATLLAKKVRSFLTMLGTIIGVAAVISIVSVMQSQNEANRDLWLKMSENQVYAYFHVNDVQQRKSIGEELMEFANWDIRGLTDGVTPNSQNSAVVSYGGKEIAEGRVYFGSEQYSLCNQYTLATGRDLCYLDIEANTSVCVIGSYTKEALFGYKEAIGETIMVGDARFTVVGVFESRTTQQEMDSEWYEPIWSADNIVLVPYTQIGYVVKNEWNRYITDFTVKCKNPEATKQAVEMLTGFFTEVIGPQEEGNYNWEKGYYNVYSNASYAEEIKDAEAGQTLTMMIVAFMSLLVGGIGIMNIMLVTVTERTREIGIRKAIGAPKRSIVTQFLIEACVLSGLGGFIGVFFGFAATLFWGKIQYNIIATPDLFTTLLAFFISVMMGIVFGIYPAAKAANLQPVDALRND